MRSLFHFPSARQKIYLVRLAIFWNHQNTSKSRLHFWPQVGGDSLCFPSFSLKFSILVYCCIAWGDYSSIPTGILKHVPFLPAFLEADMMLSLALECLSTEHSNANLWCL